VGCNCSILVLRWYQARTADTASRLPVLRLKTDPRSTAGTAHRQSQAGKLQGGHSEIQIRHSNHARPPSAVVCLTCRLLQKQQSFGDVVSASPGPTGEHILASAIRADVPNFLADKYRRRTCKKFDV
jgi:hypothetical protein